jgi:adenylosuccinate synthase
MWRARTSFGAAASTCAWTRPVAWTPFHSRFGDARSHALMCVLGAQWGDEGKGKLVDALAEYYHIVARFNGGNNAGHTVVADGKKFALHQVPSGVLYPHTMNLLGNGTVVNLPSLFEELGDLKTAGIKWEGRVLLSDRAHLVLPLHVLADCQQETAAGSAAIGTTRRGIGPVYASKAARTSLRVCDLTDLDTFVAKVRAACTAFNTTQAQAGQIGRVVVEDVVAQYAQYAQEVVAKDMIVNGALYLHEAMGDNAQLRVLAEGANAAMLDLDHGTYPMVTSSSTTVGGVCTGLGIPPRAFWGAHVVGVVKAYCTRVGSGPFPTELTDRLSGGDRIVGDPETDIGLHLQTVGAEVGVTYVPWRM